MVMGGTQKRYSQSVENEGVRCRCRDPVHAMGGAYPCMVQTVGLHGDPQRLSYISLPGWEISRCYRSRARDLPSKFSAPASATLFGMIRNIGGNRRGAIMVIHLKQWRTHIPELYSGSYSGLTS